VSVTGKDSSIFLVGAGRMGGALLRGWLAAGYPSSSIAVKEPHPSQELAGLLRDRGIPDVPRAAPDVLVLAVKPQIMAQVLKETAASVGQNTAVLSIAAGRTVAGIANSLPPGTGIVRAMPNLPAEIGRGITAAYPNEHVTPAQRDLCETLMRAVGQVSWIDDESLIDAVTAVSGSGPAYVFYLVECLAKAARDAGLRDELARQLAQATVTGAAELLHRSPLSPAQLRENVTSPGGTTAAALSILMREQGLEKLLRDAVAAAAKRSHELSE
jgi:pyrroline-5-carboxylate reductase